MKSIKCKWSCPIDLIADGDKIIYEVCFKYMWEMINLCDHYQISLPQHNKPAVNIAYYSLVTWLLTSAQATITNESDKYSQKNQGVWYYVVLTDQ